MNCLVTGTLVQWILLSALPWIGRHVAILAGIGCHVETNCRRWSYTLQWPSQRRHRRFHRVVPVVRPCSVYLWPGNRTSQFEVSSLSGEWNLEIHIRTLIRIRISFHSSEILEKNRLNFLNRFNSYTISYYIFWREEMSMD